jgi:hypothetical protein
MNVAMKSGVAALVASGVLVASLATGSPAAPGPQAASARAGQAPIFVFESRFWPNLHHFLYVLGRAESGSPDRTREAVLGAPLDTAGFGALPDAERRAWRELVTYYARKVSTSEIGSGPLVPHNYVLALGDDEALPPDALPAGLRDALLRAAPIYRANWWARHDAGNRAWQAGLQLLIERHGDRIAREMARAFRTEGEPQVPVQIVRWAMWAGAYMTEDPTLVHMSSAYAGHEGSGGLEMAYHEAGHALIVPVVDAALRREASAQGRRVSVWDLSHAILFNTAGHATRLAVPGHVHYTQQWGLDKRGPMGTYLALVRGHWAEYLRGDQTFEAAITALVRDAPELPPR